MKIRRKIIPIYLIVQNQNRKKWFLSLHLANESVNAECQSKKQSRRKLDLFLYASLFWSRFGLLLHFFLFRLSSSALAAPSSLNNIGFSTGERVICEKKMSFLRLVVVSELIPTDEHLLEPKRRVPQ